MSETTERPVLLLDIDGVLNLFPRALSIHERIKGSAESTGIAPMREHTAHRVFLSDEQMHPYVVRVPADAPMLVEQLAEHFDLRWYTMWNASAASVFAPLAGLPAFPHLQCSHTAGREALYAVDTPEWMDKHLWAAKTPLIPGYLGSRAFCWIDDDSSAVDTMWLELQPNIGPFQLITVNSATGLTQAVVDEAIEWARSLTITEELAS